MMHPLRVANPATLQRRVVRNHHSSGRAAAPTQIVAAISDIVGLRDDALARLEAVLWLAKEPLTDRKLASVLGLSEVAKVRALIARLQAALDADQSSFQVEELAGGYQLLTRPEYYPWLVRLNRSMPENKLTPTLLETLAIIAYRQPIMRAEIENIRGVRCDDVIRTLLERKLIHIAGRHDSLGRPVLYGTTKKFLESFGFKSLDELPPVTGK